MNGFAAAGDDEVKTTQIAVITNTRSFLIQIDNLYNWNIVDKSRSKNFSKMYHKPGLPLQFTRCLPLCHASSARDAFYTRER
jgi:hypothetical protein